MPDAKASGADTGGGARSRDHNQGNQGRSYTVEQKAAVLRIRRCDATAFYEILDIESVRKTCTEGEIKKAYRKQSLLTHPDKNGHEHADEAFKMVSRAFGVLGDKEKRDKYDRFGTDPDSRFASAQQQQAHNPFAGFAPRQPSAGGGRPGGPMGGGWDEDISPEEMFARFFGGGGGFGGFGGGGGTISSSFCRRKNLTNMCSVRHRSAVCIQLWWRPWHPRSSVWRRAPSRTPSRHAKSAARGPRQQPPEHHRHPPHPALLHLPAPHLVIRRRERARDTPYGV